LLQNTIRQVQTHRSPNRFPAKLPEKPFRETNENTNSPCSD
jgi:hypothetical protein